MTPATSTVYVVDDDASIREALGSLIRSIGLRVETFSSAQEFLGHRRAPGPACLVLDVRLPGASGLELQRDLAAGEERLPIIFITGHGDIPMSVRAMKAGAAEFLPKPFREQDLLDAIAQALAANTRARAQRDEVDAIRRKYETLSTRERQVLGPLVRGLLNKQVAAELGISEATVKVHRRHIMHKTQAHSLPELVRMIEKLSIAG